MGMAPQFAVFGDERAIVQVEKAEYPCKILPVSDLARLFQIETVDTALVDVVYPAFFYDGNAPANLFGRLRQKVRVVAAIDSLGDQTLAQQSRDIPIDFLVVPYALSESDKRRLSNMDCGILAGPDYALLSPDYAGSPQRLHRAEADRVLVTCGGSDPLEWTLVVMRALEGIAGPVNVRVIIGPLFSAALRDNIASFARSSFHHVEIVNAPDSLSSHMQWCDIAIAASGLTKYELAASGVPTILFSIDTFHHINNRAFANLKISLDLGGAPSEASIASAVSDLASNRERREAMSVSARNAIDGRGSERLVSKIMETLSC